MLLLAFVMLIACLSGCSTAVKEEPTSLGHTATAWMDEYGARLETCVEAIKCMVTRVANTAESPEPVEITWMGSYDSILAEYRRFAECLLDESIELIGYRLTKAIEENIFSTPSEDADLRYHWSCMQIETNIWSFQDVPRTKEAFGYAIADLNEDGNEELILLIENYTTLAIFTKVDGVPTLVDAYWPKHRCAILESGQLYTHSSGGAGFWEGALLELQPNGSALVPVKEFGCDRYLYIVVAGERVFVSEEEFDEFRSEEGLPPLSNVNASIITRESGLEFIPLFE
ncbi:MAG: hypothetical protein LBM28_05135 [Oscillospiraceae bacterium]|jgi:hypothetical protein|nr:hypothetical protein [Oscillospiraceae bacterium]